MKWLRLDETDIPVSDGIKKIKLGGKRLCLIHDQGTLYATGAVCPHAGADLSAGWCESGRLICPFHRHAFDLKSGRGDEGQGDYIAVYPLERRDDGWFVGMKESLLNRLFKK